MKRTNDKGAICIDCGFSLTMDELNKYNREHGWDDDFIPACPKYVHWLD